MFVRLHFMIHTYMNLFVEDSHQQLIGGSPLPETLTASNRGAHFMTVDKLVASFSVGDMATQTADQQI